MVSVVFGRCVNKDYGAIGCAVDVMSFADSRCSGRARCTITVADFSLHGIRPCPQDLTSYFEASYQCVQGKSRTVSSQDEQPTVIDTIRCDRERLITCSEKLTVLSHVTTQ